MLQGLVTVLCARTNASCVCVCAVNEPDFGAFFHALRAAEEELIAEGDEAGPALLKLKHDVLFPELRSPAERGRGILPIVLVRRCWKEFRDLIIQQGRTVGE